MSRSARLRPVLAALLLAATFPALAAFTDNGDGTVTDTITGLMWDKCSWGQSNTATCADSAATTHTWAQALGVAVTANGANHRGYTDWRLPNRNELESLVKINASSPAIDGTAFPNTVSAWYWSSTTYAPDAARAWYVLFDDGYPGANGKSNTNYVRLVRSGQSFASFDSLAADTTAPTLLAASVSGTTATATTLYATIDEAGTGYWIVVPQGSAVPTAAQVKAGANYGAVMVAAGGNGAMTANVAKNFAVSGLTASTAYTLYMVAEDGSANLSAASSLNVTTAAADVTPPTLSAVGVSGTGSSGTTLSATADEAATGYWIAVAQGSTAPTPAEVKAGASYGGVTVDASGNGAMSAATAKDFSVTGLAASTTYTLYIVAEDGSTNLSTVSSENVTTGAVAVNGTCGAANGVTRTSAPSASLCTTGSASAVASGAASYTWSCTGSGGGSTANCSAPRAYTVTPSAGNGGSLAPATPQTVASGGTQAFTVTPALGYQVASVTGCGGTLAGTSFTTAAVSGDCTVSASFSAATTPYYDPPPPPPTLSSGGGDLVTGTGGTVVVTDNSQSGSALTLSGAGSTQVQIGGGTLTLETAGAVRLIVTRTVGGTLGLRLEEGSLTVQGGSGRTLVVAGSQGINGGSAGGRVSAFYQAGKLRQLGVLTGSVLLPGSAFAAAANADGSPLLAGELAEFDASERVVARRLGSLEGNALGDPLPARGSQLAEGLGVPRLTPGVPERQRANGQGLSLDRQLSQVLQAYGLASQGQDASGVIRFTTADGGLYAALPLGRVQVAEGEANGLSFNADGSARAVVNGFAFLLAPTVADPGALANALAAGSPGAVSRIGTEGEWRVTEADKRVTVLRPGWALSPVDARIGNAGALGLRSDADGHLFFAHDALFGSVLYPALADRARVLAAARQVDPAATLVSTAGGDTVLTLNGQRLTLLPDYTLVDVPAARAGQPFWQEGGRVFVPVGEGKAQGFVVR